MSGIKYSQLPPLASNAIDDLDLVSLSDTSDGISVKLTVGDLKNYITSQDTFDLRADFIVSALNSYDDGSGTNGLISSSANNALFLGSELPSYYLDYNNFNNTPSDLSNFGNTTGFVKLESGELVFLNTVTSTQIGITADSIAEGSENQFYTDNKVRSFFEENFAEYYNNFATTFDEGNILDSLENVPGTFTDITDAQSSKISVTDTSVFDNFAVNQVIRVYGGSDIDEQIGQILTSWSVDTEGFTESGGGTQFSYKICEFDLEHGEISAASTEKAINIEVPAPLANTFSTVYDAFNIDNFITLSFSGVPAGRGILVYRQTPLEAEHKLIYVMGPKEINQGTWVDYYGFDYVEHSGKTLSNQYTEVVHFPLEAPDTARRGWVDRVIVEKEVTPTSMSLTLDSEVFVNISAPSCHLVHNDTALIQSAINSNSAAGRKSITLNSKTYISDRLIVPNTFGLNGVPSITTIRRLPWAGGSSNVITSNMLTVSSENASNISIVGINFDGNLGNQILFDETVNEQVNYALDFGLNASDILIDKVDVTNVIAGGINILGVTDFRLVNSRIENGGMTDRFVYSPLIATGGKDVTISSNSFRNFTDFVDVSGTNRGIITPNRIENCGTGLYVYGSTFLISSPNILLGPANEYLQTPDILNSEYDSVNLELAPAFLANTAYISPVLVYQENGELYNLDEGNGEIVYDTYYVQKSSSGAEEIYSANTGITINNIVANTNPVNGEFKFSIPTADVAAIKSANGAHSYTTLSALNSDHVGIAWSASLIQEVTDGTYSSGTANNDVYTITANSVSYSTIGSLVKLDDNGAFSLNGANTTGIVTEISKPDPQGSTYIVSIEFPGATITEGTSGTLLYIDKFVLSQGRML